MHIACSIYFLIAVIFSAISAENLTDSREQDYLAKRVQVNTRNIDATGHKLLKSKVILESEVPDLEGEDEVIDRKVMALGKKLKELKGVVVELDGTIMD